MTPRSILLIAAALLLTIGTVLVARSWIESQRVQVAEPMAPKEVNAPRVLVANANLPVGIFIKQNHLRWQKWPDDNLPKSYMVQGTVNDEELIGTVVRRSFSHGEPITADRIIKPGERGFLAAVLQAGYRAISIPIGAASGIAGLVFPGDRVDILLTHKLKVVGEDEKQDHRASETVLTNVRVLALDQKVNDQNGEPKLAKIATLEVTPKQAEILAVIRELGSLSLALRSLAKDEAELTTLAGREDPLKESPPAKGQTYTWDSEASLLVSEFREANEATNVVTVTRGKETEKVSFGSSK